MCYSNIYLQSSNVRNAHLRRGKRNNHRGSVHFLFFRSITEYRPSRVSQDPWHLWTPKINLAVPCRTSAIPKNHGHLDDDSNCFHRPPGTSTKTFMIRVKYLVGLRIKNGRRRLRIHRRFQLPRQSCPPPCSLRLAFLRFAFLLPRFPKACHRIRYPSPNA